MSVARFITDQRTLYRVPHAFTCRVLAVREAWFYKWINAPTTVRCERRALLDEAVREAFRKSGASYGSPRVWEDLVDPELPHPSHPPRRPLRHRDHRPDPGPRQRRATPLAGHGVRPLQAGVHHLAAAAEPGFPGGDRGRGDDGFTGYKSAAAEALRTAVAVMDLFHVVALAGDALDRCRQRLQQATRGHRGRTGDPLCGIRRVLRTGSELLTDRQRERLIAVFADEEHVQVEATWGI